MASRQCMFEKENFYGSLAKRQILKYFPLDNRLHYMVASYNKLYSYFTIKVASYNNCLTWFCQIEITAYSCSCPYSEGYIISV